VVLDIVARIDKIKRDDRELRFAMLASGLFNENPEVLFDELQSEEDFDSDEDPDDKYDTVKYDFSHAEESLTPEEVEREIQSMLAAASSGVNSLSDGINEEWQ
jgi:hypothetical protein